ncbi:MAG: hypothetical protein AB7Q17_03430 [Phycisphaerae bacterium]
MTQRVCWWCDALACAVLAPAIASADATISGPGAAAATGLQYGVAQTTAPAPAPARAEGGSMYRGTSDFYNVREAFANQRQGEWEFEFGGAWRTDDSESDDDFALFGNIKYGITDRFYVELSALPINLGDGGDGGAGDIGLLFFYQCMDETDWLPAFGSWISGRFPSGDGSSGVDGTLGGAFTKTLMPRLRGHLQGTITTANGDRGPDEYDRRDFQWGAGVGIDYEIDEKTYAILNYTNTVSDEVGNGNLNVLEVGVTHNIVPGQRLRAAVDIGLDDNGETPNFVAKFLWAIDWGT